MSANRLVSLLDLRFAEPKLEQMYHIYYARVKRNLLPTAIQVVLLVNCSQFFTTCLSYYMLTTSSNNHYNNHKISTSPTAAAAATTTTATTTPQQSRPSTFPRTLLWPILLQLLIFVITIPMHRMVSAETKPTSQSNEASASNQRDLKFRLTRRRRRSTTNTSNEIESRHTSIELKSPDDNNVDADDNVDERTEFKQSSSKPILNGQEDDEFNMKHNGKCRHKLSLPYLLWFCQLMQLVSGLWPHQSFLAYSTLFLYSYAIYVTLPIRLHSCILLAVGLSIIEPTVDYLLWLNSAQLWTFIILALGVNAIGIMSFFFYERQQRAAFLETRQSIETKLILEQESREQERLLLSILPKHLAAEIRQDLGAVVTGQFKKIYMSRHENVSILFADIVGFTAISSHCPAHELVRTLNELFARFDKLAEKYHQLRIKILGDCYYAISGAPKERPDHAVLCVHMGLSMVDAIRSVRERTKSVVDMRVGVHTGGVLAGVLGQRQWQFDVYSKDVELANKMESSGLPGRVHISDATLRFLNDEFEVSEGDGASREEALRLANIKTYFIDRVKKPYPEGTLDALPAPQGATPAPTTRDESQYDVVIEIKEATIQTRRHQKQQLAKKQPMSTPSTSSLSSAKRANTQKSDSSQSVDQKQRNDSFNSTEDQMKSLSLNFRNCQFELQFRSTSDITSCISLAGLPVTLLCAFLAYISLYKADVEICLVYILDCALLIFSVLICVLPYFWRRKKLNTNQATAARAAKKPWIECLTIISDSIGESAWMKLVLSALMTLVWLSAHLIACFKTHVMFNAHDTLVELESDSLSLKSHIIRLFSVDLLNYFSITCALAITAITRISFLIKTLLILIVILIQVILNFTLLVQILNARSKVNPLQLSLNQNYYHHHAHQSSSSLGEITNSSSGRESDLNVNSAQQDRLQQQQPPTSFTELTFNGHVMASIAHQLSGLFANYDQFVFVLTLVTIFMALYLINRQFELTNRRLFLWRKQVEERKEKVADMRQKNEALVYNILPRNVAKIFLGKRQLNDEELYSKSYDAVGVLFAAMPNFSDFYTEESVNNQGLECLRFLNEVISDYDALLDQARFKNIIKIKTMGPTYMAASGLYEGDARAERQVDLSQSDTSEKRSLGGPETTAGPEIDQLRSKWGHLEQLTEFALALKDTLNNINKESFNNFVLRIGINHGPITAGVIGVKKPHFDMWGNTVNVASRMESTGRAGSIQVVEETANILQCFGFQFDQRGIISVKGKGKLMTYYLTGRRARVQSPTSND